jgi:PAS domain S-box-containing protein
MSSTSKQPDEPRLPRTEPRAATPSRIIGEGEMADLIRAFDWGRTRLGPVDTWPDTLITTVNLLLASRHPMFLWWGPELIQFYNDGYRPSIRADKHPTAVGQRGAECWPEIWSIIGPQIDAVMNEGASTWHINQLVPINRDGKLEEVYWTYSYSPVRDNRGAVQGTLVVCTETTDQVLNERRLKTLLAVTVSERSETQLAESRAVFPFAQEIVEALQREPTDIPFAALYQVTPEKTVCLSATPEASLLSAALHSPIMDAVRSQRGIIWQGISEHVSALVCKPWPEPVTRAYVLPLAVAGTPVETVLIFGISPRLPFDDSYETFFKVVGAKIAALVHSEVQRLELLRAAIRFRALVNTNPFGTVIGSLEGPVSYISPVFLKTLGYSEDEVTSGKVRWDKLTPPEYAEADARAIAQLRAEGQCDVYEKAYLAKDGSRIPILIGASIIENPGEEPEFAAFVTELTPLKQAEEALQKANDDLERKVRERTAALETEVSERKRMEISLRELTGRLLTTRDEERRHMARELHDNAGQTLAALTMNLSAIQDECGDADSLLGKMASEAEQLSEELNREIRTLSYLLHPPLLDEVGLESAIRWYVEGFSERSKIEVDLELPSETTRLPRELELVLFRVIQESLTNVHRHSASPSAKILLTRSEGRVAAEISDRGKGISPEKQQRDMVGAKLGVGIRGMQERVRQYGGTLEILSSDRGTTVVVNLPVSTQRASESN